MIHVESGILDLDLRGYKEHEEDQLYDGLGIGVLGCTNIWVVGFGVKGFKSIIGNPLSMLG